MNRPVPEDRFAEQTFLLPSGSGRWKARCPWEPSGLRPNRSQSLPVDGPIDAIVAGGVARRFAIAHLAEPRFASTFAIVAAELANNMAHHTSGGVLRLEWTPEALVIEAQDRGGAPLLHRGRGLGLGEGAVERLSDRVEVRLVPGGGREVRAVLLWREEPT